MVDLLVFGNSRFELIAESVLRWLSYYFASFEPIKIFNEMNLHYPLNRLYHIRNAHYWPISPRYLMVMVILSENFDTHFWFDR